MNQKQLYITMILVMVLWVASQSLNRHHAEYVSVNQNMDQEMIRKGPYVSDAFMNRAGKKYALGLALSGGGIKCLCHVGVLKALDEENLKPDVISGVSAGAVVAALYADGYSPDSINSLMKSVHFSEFFRFEMPNGGFLSLTGFKEFLDTVLHAKTFEELKIPLKVIATNLDQGKSVVFDRGPLVDALVATCSVPILFCPYKINGINYVDGGVLQNLPASEIRMNSNYLIGVSVGPLNADPYEKSITNIALRSYRFIFRSNSNYDKSLCDMVIEPPAISQFNGGDVDRIQEIFDLGYHETKRMIQEQKKEQELKKAQKQTRKLIKSKLRN